MQHQKNKSLNILVVEDNPLDALIVQTLLQHHFNMTIVSNGHDALKIIEEVKFDIILMDINLGDDDLNGINVMKIIKENAKHKHIKVFAVTAYAENTDFFINQGFDELYVKPVIKEDIFEFINKGLINNTSV